MLLGYPSVAISHGGYEPTDYKTAGLCARRIVKEVMFRGLPPDTVLNVNLPWIDPAEVKGVHVTTLARRAYIGSLTRALDPNGREYFWIGGGESKWWGRGEEDTDYDAVRSGYISITPVHLDLTNHRVIPDLEKWESISVRGEG